MAGLRYTRIFTDSYPLTAPVSPSGGNTRRVYSAKSAEQIASKLMISLLCTKITVENVFVNKIPVRYISVQPTAADNRKKIVFPGNSQNFFMIDHHAFLVFQPQSDPAVAISALVLSLAFLNQLHQLYILGWSVFARFPRIVPATGNTVKQAHLCHSVLIIQSADDREDYLFINLLSFSKRKFFRRSTSISS